MHHPGDVIAGALIGTGIQVRRKSYKPFYLLSSMTTAFFLCYCPFSDIQCFLQFTTVSKARYYPRRMEGETTTLVKKLRMKKSQIEPNFIHVYCINKPYYYYYLKRWGNITTGSINVRPPIEHVMCASKNHTCPSQF